MTDTLWPEFVKPGVFIRATAKPGGVVVEAKIARIDNDDEIVVATPTGERLVGIYPNDYLVEPIPAPLPTGKGIYVDNEGDYWLIQDEGGDLRYFSRADGVIERDDEESPDPAGFTFTRMIPEGASA
jgi:hypothetical protein